MGKKDRFQTRAIHVGNEPDHDDWFINWTDDDASIILAD